MDYPMRWLYFILLGVPVYRAQLLYPTEAHYLIYGDLVNMQESFLPRKGEKIEEPTSKNVKKISLIEAISDAYMLKPADEIIQSFNASNRGPKSHYEAQLDQINSDIFNLSTKLLQRVPQNFRRVPQIPQQFPKEKHWNAWYMYDHWDRYNTPQREIRKLRKLVMISLQLLVHARQGAQLPKTVLFDSHFVDYAMRQRRIVRNDKRFKIGYLFCRYRRIKYEMLKLIHVVKDQSVEYYHGRRIHNLIRVYEEVLRMDVDARDTAMMIKHLYEIVEEYDTLPDVGQNNDTLGEASFKMPQGKPTPSGYSGKPDDFLGD